MKHTKLFFLAVFLLLFSCRAEKEIYLSTSFHEPANGGLRYIYSEDAIHWDSIPGTWLKPEVGAQKVLRDPSITHTPDGTYHLVWTSSWKGDYGFGYAHSKDLIHWSDEQLIPVMAKESETVNVWAPEIFYDDVKKKIVVVWASCVPHRFEKGIEDENNNHRLYYITTKDFKTISETKLFYDPGFSVIDATIVKRGKEDYVLVMKDNTRAMRNLKVAFAKSPTGPYTSASVPFSESFVEGPTVAKVDKDYYIYFDVYERKIFGAMKTRDFIHFQDKTDELKMPKGHKHGTIVKVPYSDVKSLLKYHK
ncbi:glycoside hydrolase family 43 protein [uncultured Bacteroides sp.]|uniref:glycoside hydrolase family 43 protein n=1 Tax=uncultured Bacteroides sp. TaxID=162156 RepID=UPI002AAB4030|nr:glycoside hydrolase family 43 protein [uncultured Bacteroides sp.]